MARKSDANLRTWSFIIATSIAVFAHVVVGQDKPSVGGGTITDPAIGPAPSHKLGGDGFVLVKNWDFGQNGTIKSIADLTQHFQYHDQFGTIGNGTNYGALTVAADAASAIGNQPVEDQNHPVRKILDNSMRTFLVPLDGATAVRPTSHNAGCGSFQAKWTLPKGGSLLGQDMLWETRVRYVTPAYFWFAIWTCGDAWDKGAEVDLVESFGYDNGGGNTNYDGRFWHSDGIGGPSEVRYDNWENAMRATGVLTKEKPSFDPTAYHIWTWLYRADDTYSCYVDGIEVQKGSVRWTLGGKPDGKQLNMSFLFDGGWGHTQVGSVNHALPASEFEGKYYEWDYSRVYLRDRTDSKTAK